MVGPDALTRIFSASEPFSLLCSQPSPLAGLKNGPSAAIAGCISSPGLGFCALLLGSRAFQTFGGYLIPAFPCLGGGKEGCYGSSGPERSEQKRRPLDLQPRVAVGRCGAAPGGV